MTRLLRLAAACYPRWWRRRYAREFEALLDDLAPGPRNVLDVLTGALIMHTRTVSKAIPLVGAIAGAVLAGLVAAASPAVYAASATIRLEMPIGPTAREPALAPILQSSLGKAIPDDASRSATSVVVLDADATHTTLQMTYADRDAARAHEMVERLVAAMTVSDAFPGSSVDVLEAPTRPSSPRAPAYHWLMISGGTIGFALGLCGVWISRLRRGPALSG